MNTCSACGENFGGVGDFDSHRYGSFPQTGPAEWLDRVRVDLEDWDYEPGVSQGRRCKTSDEMVEAGWEKNARDGWVRRLRRFDADIRERLEVAPGIHETDG